MRGEEFFNANLPIFTSTSDTKDRSIFHIAMAHQLLTTFTSFPRLPVELQERIWTLALPTSRVFFAARAIKVGQAACTGAALVRQARLPGYLHACRASRRIALERRGRLTHSRRLGPGYPVFIDLNNDVVYIDRSVLHDSRTIYSPIYTDYVMPLDDLATTSATVGIGYHAPCDLPGLLSSHVVRRGGDTYYLCVGGEHVVHASQARMAQMRLFDEDMAVLLPLPLPGDSENEIQRRIRILERYAAAYDANRARGTNSLAIQMGRALWSPESYWPVFGPSEEEVILPTDLGFGALGEKAIELARAAWLKHVQDPRSRIGSNASPESKVRLDIEEQRDPYEGMPMCIPAVMFRHCEGDH